MIFSCLIAGVGGQGTAFMLHVMGAAASARGLSVRGSVNAGTGRPGLGVESHFRTGSGIHSPLIPRGKAGLIIALEPAEAVRVHSFLSPAGIMLVLDRGIMPQAGTPDGTPYDPAGMVGFLREYLSFPGGEGFPLEMAGDRLITVDGAGLEKKCGSARVLNTALLGIAAGKNLFPFTADDISAALREISPPEWLDINIRAFEAGKGLAAAGPPG